jgi:hypothetical protein
LAIRRPVILTPDHIPAGLDKAALIEDASVRSGVLATLLGFQARTEPEVAIRAMSSHSLEGASAAYVLETALRSWAGTDLTAASAWLAAQPPGKERDGAIWGFNEVARVAEPDSALQWAMTISEPQQREQAVLRTLQSWRTLDPSAAAVALEGLALPEEKKTALAKHRDVFSASQQAFGHWLIMDPMKMLPLLDHFDAGPAKNDLVKQSARYYLENAGEEAAAETWFARLPPDLQAQAADKARTPDFYQMEPTRVETFQRIWTTHEATPETESETPP